MSDVGSTFKLRRLRIAHHSAGAFGVTRVVDAETGEEIRNITSLEIFQTAATNPMFAVVKIIGVVDSFSGEVQASVDPVREEKDEASR